MQVTSAATVAQLAEFDEVIDVRSPAEFAEDHVPRAVNCPVLDDEERARVGTIYKQVSAFEAKKAGAALVARNIARHLEQAFRDRPRDWHPLIYCWRGGQRSGAMAQVFNQIGWRAAQLDGGYKAYRREVLAALQTLPQRLDWRGICGATGSGKSKLLRTLEQAGAQALDLEQLACHRGSVLGAIPNSPQPSQRMFESLIWHALRRFDPGSPVFVESESRKIGALRVPESLLEAMWQAPCFAIEADVATRVGLLMEEYRHFCIDTGLLGKTLDALTGLYGRHTIEQWKAQAACGNVEALVRDLLERHYDPAYTRSIRKHYTRLTDATRFEVDDTSDAAMKRLASRVAATA